MNLRLIHTFWLLALLLSCEKEVPSTPTNTTETGFFSGYQSRNFKMGFTSWPFGPNLEDVNVSYDYIAQNGDIYVEHIDNKIPWKAWINDEQLPQSFTNEINGKVNRRMNNKDLLLSVSVLHTDRKDLAHDFDDKTPIYSSINEQKLIDAYTKHVDYLIGKFTPMYLVISIEANELKLHLEVKWNQYKPFITTVTQNIKNKYPNLKIAESITLHNLYEPNVSNPDAFANDIIDHMNHSDFVAISFYPFFKNQHHKTEFQKAFNYLHYKASKPIAFVETAHLAEDLIVAGLNLNISGNEMEQNDYLETLLTNAQMNNYEFVIWWAHRDYDSLWNTFPESVKDIGKLWRDTGLLNENAKARISEKNWNKVYSKTFTP